MANRLNITPDLCRKLLAYDPATGVLVWRQRDIEMFAHCTPGHQIRIMNGWNAAWAGKVAGVVDGYGYITVTIFAKHFRAHRVIWAMQNGAWPTCDLDHINGNRSDNRLENLRPALDGSNQRNMKKSLANTSGVTGVYLCRTTGRWRAEVICKGVKHRLGRFDTIEAAKVAVEGKRSQLDFSDRHGKDGIPYDAWRARH